MNQSKDPQDDDLRDPLRELGHAGERRAPSFSNAWRAAKEKHADTPPRRLPVWMAATAAATLVLLAIAVWPPRPAPAIPVPIEIAHDEPLPTDFLLVTNNDDPVERLAGEIDALLKP